MGDSHPKRGVNPEEIPGSFIFADVGENYIQTYYKLRGVLEYPGVDVEYVVFPVDLHSFSSMRRDQLKNAWYWYRIYSILQPGYADRQIKKFIEILGLIVSLQDN